MLVYKDLISGDEMASDSFPTKEVDDLFIHVQTNYVNRAGIKINTGANPSAEGTDEDAGEDYGGEIVNDLIDSFNLTQVAFDKKSFLAYIKEYMKEIKKRLSNTNPERVTKFQEAAGKSQLSHIISNLKDYEFYTGSSMDPEGMVVIMGYEDEAKEKAPYALLFKDGLQVTKQ